MKQSEEYRSRHSMEVPGKSTEVPGGCTEVPDNCQELPWSRKKSLYGCHENAAWQQLTDWQLRRMAIEQIRHFVWVKGHVFLAKPFLQLFILVIHNGIGYLHFSDLTLHRLC